MIFENPSEMFLTKEELIQLTGRERIKGQVDFLAEHGFNFVVNMKGLPVVSKHHVIEKLSSESDKAPDSEPDFSSMN